MNNIATRFSIKDLENLSGIKAHTIRIWEKRYHLLTPSRTATDIRYYDIENLKKLLNVTLLYNAGVKISKLAQWKFDELQIAVREHISKNDAKKYHLDSLKLAMFNFDQSEFEITYNQLLAENSFRDVFVNVFIPWLHTIGLLWQSNTIVPVHENFMSNLIKQKLLINIEKVQQIESKTKKTTFVLFLPPEEIHELGLLYIHYELILNGYHSIYLGQSVPTDNLKSIIEIYPIANFIGYFTVAPESHEVESYLKQLNEEILKSSTRQLWVLGRNVKNIEMNKNWNSIKKFDHIKNLIEKL